MKAPPEAKNLEDAVKKNADSATLGKLIFALLIEQTLLFDVDNDTGGLMPTVVNVNNPLNNFPLQKKMNYLYTYGMSMCMGGRISEEDLKDLILSKMAARVNMDGAALDNWLGM